MNEDRIRNDLAKILDAADAPVWSTVTGMGTRLLRISKIASKLIAALDAQAEKEKKP